MAFLNQRESSDESFTPAESCCVLTPSLIVGVQVKLCLVSLLDGPLPFEQLAGVPAGLFLRKLLDKCGYTDPSFSNPGVLRTYVVALIRLRDHAV